MNNQFYFSRFVFALIFFSVASLMGCASSHVADTSRADEHAVVGKTIYKGNLPTRLKAHMQSWRGAPYKYGGLNRRGIDCSGFVYVTYRDVFGRKLPRSTELLASVGREVSRHKLRAGDLVFFKTGRKQKHVGIYVGQGRFIHASTSKGVVTSKLSSKYWASHYWKSVQVS